MLTFEYTARDPASGQRVKSEVQAENEQMAAKLVREQGLAPIDIRESHGGAGLLHRAKKVKAKDRILFSRQLATLINAGLPLIQSLRNVGQQATSKTLQGIINQLISDVEAGSALSSSLAKHPQVFNQIFVNLVAAGEASGTLDASLERLATQQEKDAEIVSKVRGAMVYPIIVLVVMLGVVGFMIVSVLPQVQVLYDGIPGVQLPLVTRILLAISQFIIKYWWVVLIVLGVGVFFTTRWARTGPGKQVVDGLKMRMPPIGPLFMKMYMARFSRTGSTLVASGVPLIQMLEITSQSINNVHIEASLKAAIEKVKGGKSLSDSIGNDPNFLSLVPSMLKIGEQSGSMEEMLGRTADYFEKEVDTQIKAISTIIEPIMMVILGVLALIVVSAVLLPIYSLAGKITVI